MATKTHQPRARRAVAIPLLIAFSVATTAPEGTARARSPEAGHTPEAPPVPVQGARQYDVTPDAAWDAALRVFKGWRLRKETRSEDHGLLISQVQTANSGRFTLGVDRIDGRFGLSRVQYHVFIPTHLDRARVFVDSVSLAAGRVFYRVPQIADAFFAELDEELGQVGKPVPADPAHRFADDMPIDEAARCHAVCEAVDPKRGPTLIQESKLTPRYPSDAARDLLAGHVLLFALVDRDGIVSDVEMGQSSGDTELDTSAVESVRLWRFEPLVADGCRCRTRFAVYVSFEM